MKRGNEVCAIVAVVCSMSLTCAAVGQPSFTEISPEGVIDVHQSAVALCDLDGDGDRDLVLAGRTASGPGSATTRVYFNYRAGGFQDISAGLTDVGENRPDVACGDYDNDGDLDIALGGTDPDHDNVLQIYRNDGDGNFTDINGGLTPISACSLAWGDYDNDGDLDLVAAGLEAPGIASTIIYRNDGEDTFVDSGIDLVGLFYSAVAWGDYDRDGDLDLAMVGYDSGDNAISIIYDNNLNYCDCDGTGVLPFSDHVAGLTSVAEGTVGWADYDNDGDLDLALAGATTGGDEGNVTKVYRNDDGVFDEEANLTGAAHSSSLVWGDFDQDGDADLAVCGAVQENEGRTTLYRNNDGTFVEVVEVDFLDVKSCDLAWTDYDIDGDLDLFLTGQTDDGSPNTRIYRNELNSGQWVDVDNDGDVDLMDYVLMQVQFTGPMGP